SPSDEVKKVTFTGHSYSCPTAFSISPGLERDSLRCGTVGRPCQNGGGCAVDLDCLVSERGDLRSGKWHGRETVPQQGKGEFAPGAAPKRKRCQEVLTPFSLTFFASPFMALSPLARDCRGHPESRRSDTLFSRPHIRRRV